jgi:hypothetical protein
MDDAIETLAYHRRQAAQLAYRQDELVWALLAPHMETASRPPYPALPRILSEP